MKIQARIADMFDIDIAARLDADDFPLPPSSLTSIDDAIMLSLPDGARMAYLRAEDADDAEMRLRMKARALGMTPDNVTLIGE